MDDTFQLRCKNCGSKLTAKVALVGQTRNCPKCKTPVLIQRDVVVFPPMTAEVAVNEPSIAPIKTGPSLNEGVGRIEDLPERLSFRNRYFILSADRLIATWETGKGWQVNIGSGFSPAKKNVNAIPDQGTFQLVELVIAPASAEASLGGVPTSVNVFKISVRGALTALYKDEGTILERVDCASTLSKQQKNLLLGHLRRMFMFETLSQASELMSYFGAE